MRGFLGPGPVDVHVRHAWPLVDELAGLGTIVDLGSGGGVPALVLAVALPASNWALVEAQQRRAVWLTDAARALGVADRVLVLHERAEVTGRGPWRGRAAAVVSRAFGPPAVTAECAAPLLAVGATCWVSEPPGPGGGRRSAGTHGPAGDEGPASVEGSGGDRWPAGGLAELGLSFARRAPGWAGLTAVAACPDRYPRRVGIPAKRPLF